MFLNSFWFQFAVFVVAQGVALGFLRTGLLVRGAALVVTSWIAVDVALVARFAFENTGATYTWALIVLQVHTLVEASLLLVGRIRHHSPKLRADREVQFRSGFRAYLRDRLEPAGETFRKLARRDPWDLESTLAWATVLSRQGAHRKARGLLLRVRWLDRDRRFRDVIESERARAHP